MIETSVDPSTGVLHLSFPERVVSTSVTEINQEVWAFLRSPEVSQGPLKSCRLTFDKTRSIDSLGLNLVVGLLVWCEQRQLPVEAYVRETFIQMVFRSVWLDQKMQMVPIIGVPG